MAQVKISSFYGQDVARPYLLIDAETGKPVTDRVNQPSANDPLLKWAKKATFASGGALIGPNSAVEVPKARSEIDIFSESHRAEILAANPNLLSHPDPKFFKICASLFWKEQLTDEERQRFRDMAAEERRKAKEALAAMEASDPQFKARREKELEYKKAKQQEASAARATNGPLWAAQKRKTTAQRRSTPKPRRPKLRIVRKKRPSKNLNGIKRSKARREAAAAADAKEADVDESDMSDGGSDLESEELMEEFSEEEAEEDMEPRPAPYPEDMEQDEAEVPAEAKAPVKSAKEVKKSGVGYTDEFELPSESAPSVPVARVTRNKVAKPNVPLETEKKKQTLKKRR